MVKEEAKSNQNLWFFVIMMPVIFFVMVALYLLLKNMAQTNPKICDFTGNIWLSEVQTPDHPSPKVGCFSWEEVYR